MISVIIPAHNEASVIARSLSTLIAGAPAGAVEIVVVCNGCTDETARCAASVNPSVRVRETAIASKINALNLGDSIASGFPRFYLDADIVISFAELLRLANELLSKSALAVAPRFRMELAGCSWAVRSFYAINDLLPSSREGIGGSGVYGMSEEGRRRFEKFPNLTADDGFVRIQFRPEERRCVAEACSTVFAPKSLKELIAIKTRSHYGTRELRERYPHLWQNKGASNAATLKRLMLRFWLWPKLAIYAYVKIAARIRSSRRWRSSGPLKWERDDTSRSGAELSRPLLHNELAGGAEFQVTQKN